MKKLNFHFLTFGPIDPHSFREFGGLWIFFKCSLNNCLTVYDASICNPIMDFLERIRSDEIFRKNVGDLGSVG